MVKKSLLILMLVLIALFSVSCGGSGEKEEKKASVLFVNVRKADCAIVMAGEKTWLIDTGDGSTVDSALYSLQLLGIKEIEGIFFSHTHGDHTGGFSQVAAQYDINALYCARIYEDNDVEQNMFDNLSTQYSIPLKKLREGNSVKAGGCRFEVLGPIQYNSSDDNDNSLVIRLTAFGKRFLFTGDMQFPEEATLIEAGVDLSADILKVGNHGNPDATSDAFAEAVQPEIVVISTDTSIDHDSANTRVLALFQGKEIYITQNYLLGVMVTVTESGKITVEGFPEQ